MPGPFSEHVVGPLIFGIVIFILFCCVLRGCLVAILQFVQAKSKARKSAQSNQELEKDKSLAHMEDRRQLHAQVVTIKSEKDTLPITHVLAHDDSLKMIIIQ